MGVDRIVLIGVNYGSSDIVDAFVRSWSKLPQVVRIIVVDNFSTDAEVSRIAEIARSHDKVEVLLRTNDGYGAALNAGIDHAMTRLDCRGALLLFGNVDVTPVSVSLEGVDTYAIPEIAVFQGGKLRPVFLTKLQSNFIGLTRVAIWTGSAATLALFHAVNKVLGLIPSATWAVHGSLFALTAEQVAKVHPIFDPRAFLYCEELFFARKVARLKTPYRRIPITVEHIGSVSTGTTAKNWANRWFTTWRQSARVFFEDAGP